MEIKKATFIKSIVKLTDAPRPELPEIAIIGRSNVGKSSLINSLTGRKKLVQVSKNPGKTRLINYFLINQQFYVVDLPGYGFARVSQKERQFWKHIIEDYLKNSTQLRLTLLLTDCRHGLLKNDEHMREWLEFFNRPYLIVATKADKIAKTKLHKQLRDVYPPELMNNHAVLPHSSVSGQGNEELLDIFEDMLHLTD